MNIRKYLKEDRVLYLDGGMGTILQEMGLKAGELPERWNIERPDDIISIHKAYFDAGSNIVNTNTFGANRLKYSDDELDRIICAAVKNARKAAELSSGKQEKYVALDIGPCGRLLKPYGDFDFEEAVALFSQIVDLGAGYGVDLVTIETMADSYETKAAMLAVKENSDLPFFVTNAYGEDGKLMTGASCDAMIALIEGMGASALGVNCSLGPQQLRPVVNRMLENASIPVIVKPNAGLPHVVDGMTVYDIGKDEFADSIKSMVLDGVKVIGGCCGTTPEYIGKLVEETETLQPPYPEEKELTWISSYTHSVRFGERPVLIGERLNPTGKKLLKKALIDEDMDFVLGEGIRQEEAGAQVLDVNVGLPEIDESRLMPGVVKDLQSVIDLPLCIDTSDPVAMENALRCYNGKALINSVSGKRESMDSVFPLVAKYGGCVVALTLDDEGIPETSEGRIAIAARIIDEAARYGINKKDLIFDALTLTVSAEPGAAKTTLDTVQGIGNGLGCRTILGVSNVSFGLPHRDSVNSVFFATALDRGLSAAIMNPLSRDMMGAYHSYLALNGYDENFKGYIDFFDGFEKTIEVRTDQQAPGKRTTSDPDGQEGSDLRYSIVKGLKEKAREASRQMLESRDPLEIIEEEIIPALNIVGDGFEKKEVYLPQLLMSAEAAGASFEVIKKTMTTRENVHDRAERSKFVVATVKGDIHDIGKNIVKLLLQNYGFDVKDLGKDVAPEDIVEAVVRERAPLCGLSALMTTTVPAMEETIRQLKAAAPWCKVVVGGAVLNQEYADTIGADKYGRDAMDTVRFAEMNEAR